MLFYSQLEDLTNERDNIRAECDEIRKTFENEKDSLNQALDQVRD